MQNLGPYARPFELEIQEMGPIIRVLASLPSDSDTSESLKTTALCEAISWLLCPICILLLWDYSRATMEPRHCHSSLSQEAL